MKTAEELKIKADVFTALHELLRMMEAGEIKHADVSMIGKGVMSAKAWKQEPAKLFNMSTWCVKVVWPVHLGRPKTCNTIMCMGGSAEALMGREFKHNELDSNAALSSLFFPPRGVFMEGVTEREAARVLRGYLETGEVRWKMSLGR